MLEHVLTAERRIVLLPRLVQYKQYTSETYDYVNVGVYQCISAIFRPTLVLRIFLLNNIYCQQMLKFQLGPPLLQTS